ncbi:MAG: methylamine utilization protein [Alphaproteobacteria bacterium]
MRAWASGLGPIAVAAAIASGAMAAEHTVTMGGSAYGPKTLKAKVGDTIVFDNDDFDNHVVFVPTVGFGIDLGAQKPGEKRSMTLRRAGKLDVECVLHEDMHMTVEVTQ